MKNDGHRIGGVLVLVVSIYSLLLLAAPVVADYAVENLTVKKVGVETMVNIHLDGEPMVRHFTLDNGERIVIDCQNALHRLPQKNYRQLPDCGIIAIRTSQFSLAPQKVVRLVLDMEGSTPYKLTEEDRQVSVTFSHPGGEEFDNWTAKGDPPPTPPKEQKVNAPSPERKPPEGTPLPLYPQRQVVKYRDGSRRDPFKPLAQTENVSFGSLPQPEVENLALVGILEDEISIRALLEDVNGYGYILRKGDKVRNGVVVEVSKRRIVFRITEYGWSRTVALELETVE